MTGPAPRPSAVELALGMIDSGESPDANAVGARALQIAWALKNLCYAAWASEPQRAARAADALRTLCAVDAADAEPAAAHAIEMAALADWTCGIAHITRGQMVDATLAFDRAADAFKTLGRAECAAQTQVPKIMALSMLGRYDEAVACAERTQREFVQQGDVRGAGKVSLNLGALHSQRGAHADCARHSREAAMLFARVGDHQHSISADLNHAHALASMGDFDEALRIFARARMRAGTHGFPVLEALVDELVAMLQLSRGHYQGALNGLEAARLQYEQLAMPQHLAMVEKQLADVYLELRLLPEALVVFDRVLLRFKALDMPSHEAWTLAQRGRVQALLGQSAQATETFRLAAERFAALGSGLGESAVALARSELALAAGDPATAACLAEAAARGFAAASLADGRLRADVVRAHALLLANDAEGARALFTSTGAAARDLQLLTVQVRCLTGEGMAAQRLGDGPAARIAFDAAIELFEDQRRALPGDELRSAFLTDHLRPYRELLRMALADHAEHPSPERATLALHQLDRIRARALNDRLTEGAGAEGSAATQRLRERLNWLYRRVRHLEDAGEPTYALGDELRRTELELLEGARRARLVSQTPGRAIAGDDDFKIATLQARLGEHDALVEYGVQGDELFACVVTRAGVVLHRNVAAWSEVRSAVRAARFQIDTLRHGAAPLQKHLAHLTARTRLRTERLHALVWAPLQGALADAQRVLVVPHAQLGLLPFAALDDGRGPLAERLEIAVVPSARLAARGLGRPAVAPRKALVLGESSRLAHAEREARLVAALFGEAQTFVGETATLAALQAHAGGADVIHLACHGQFRSDNPMFSALHLHDGALTGELAESLGLRPGIVVLSACETGLAEFGGGGDEMVGLVRAFLVAGTARVLASLWPVDDAVTAGFMTSFYGALCRGEAPAAALRRAQTDVMREHPHPFYWAAFTLYGGW